MILLYSCIFKHYLRLTFLLNFHSAFVTSWKCEAYILYICLKGKYYVTSNEHTIGQKSSFLFYHRLQSSVILIPASILNVHLYSSCSSVVIFGKGYLSFLLVFYLPDSSQESSFGPGPMFVQVSPFISKAQHMQLHVATYMTFSMTQANLGRS